MPLIVFVAFSLIPHPSSLVPAHALPIFRRMFEAKYQYKASCTLCHDRDNWDLNAYSKEFLKKGRTFKAFEELEKGDQDEDGFKTEQELAARSSPSDPRSTPEKIGKWLENIPELKPPKKTLKLLFPGASRFEAAESPEFSDGAMSGVEKTLGAVLREEDKYPVLFKAFGPEDRFLGAAAYCTTDEEEPKIWMLGLGKDGTLAGLAKVHVHGKIPAGYPDQYRGKTWKSLAGTAAVKKSFQKDHEKTLSAVRRTALILEALSGISFYLP